MGRIRERVADTKSWLPVFILSVFFIYIWSIVFTLQQIPAWILRDTIWELVGKVSYLLLAALFESAALVLLCFLLALPLPANTYHEKFGVLAGGFVIVNTAWSAGLHLTGANPAAWTMLKLLLIGGLYLLSTAGALFAAGKIKIIKTIILGFAERIAVLSYFYFATSILAAIIVLVRQFGA